MKKPNIFSKLIFGLAVLFSGLLQAQTSSGYTHAINFTQDCYYGNASWDIDFSLTVYTGGHSNFRVENRYYRGDWNYGSMGARVVGNETLISTVTSSVYYYFPYVVAGTPIVFSTADFYTTAPHLTKYRNGAYRATTTLQKQIGGVWTDLFTTPLSTAYGIIDVPPYPTFGDLADVAVVDELSAGGYFDFTINGVGQANPPTTYVTCPAVDLVLDNVTDWQNNPGTATLTVEQGFFTPSTYNFNSTSSASTTFAVDGADKNLTSLFSLGIYNGPLRVTYQLPDDDCYGTLTPVVKTMTISVSTAAFLNDYSARIISDPSCSGNSKAISTTWNITTAMPTGANLSAFRCAIKAANGWAGAFGVGLNNLTFLVPYAVDVYEVDPSTGVRLSGAPSLFMKNGTTPTTDNFSFNDSGFGTGFDSGNPPYYNDVTGPADPIGTAGFGFYFKDYYAFAKGPGGIGLTAFSAKVFCAEVSQFPSGGCVVNMKSYFRIANASFSNAGTARLAGSDEGDANDTEYMSLEVYPNPTKGELVIPVTEDDINVSMIIMDNLGKQVMSIADVKANKGNVNIENLTAGIYFYTINKDNSIYRGKIVKQ